MKFENEKINKADVSRQIRKDFDGGDELKELFYYVSIMHHDLLQIKKFYKKEFLKIAGNSIDEYIGLFQKYANSLFSTCFYAKQLIVQKNFPFATHYNLFWKDGKFLYGQKNFFPFKVLKFDDDHRPTGIKEKYFQKIEKIAKKIFMLEKICSFSTQKIWQQEIEKLSGANFSRDRAMIVKVIFPGGWQKEISLEGADKWQTRRCQSTSLIDNAHSKNLFLYDEKQECACLVVKPNQEKIICASSTDMWSTETTTQSTKSNQHLAKHTGVTKILTFDDNLHHAIYAYGTLISTPKGLLGDKYNEVLMVDPEYCAVYAPNKNSADYAKVVAEKMDLPFFVME